MRIFLVLMGCAMSYASLVRSCLSEWVSSLLEAVPLRSQATFVELLCGCLISPEGWVTRVISAMTRRRHWTTYYKLIERGSVRTVRLARALFTLIRRVLPWDVLTLVLDDTLVLRHSDSAPGCSIRFDHARKKNRPAFVQAQGWVTLGVSLLGRFGARPVLPVLSRLVPEAGNRNKLAIALTLIRALAPVFSGEVRVLMDAWFMRARLIQPLLKRGLHVIGQVRRDTALFLPPAPRSGRGRPRKYGARLTAADIAAWPATEMEVFVYGEHRRIRVRSALVLARFLKGTPVRAVWCEFYDAKNGRWNTPRLILATETELTAEMIVRIYARRWGIEPLFHNLKRWWGMNNLWQQSRRALELWMMIRSCAWSLAQLLALVVEEQFPITAIAPWRKGEPITAGLVAQWLRVEYTGLAFRDGFDRKSRKFTFPEARNDPRLRL
jgi:hypothetical protein